MKVVLLAGGFGTRIAEDNVQRPKPMLEIGGMPILWHIMKEYSYYGYNDFIICAGYMQHVIKDWFANYFLHSSDVTFSYKDGKNEMKVRNSNCEPWEVTIADTGYNTMTGGRIKRIQRYVGNETFMMTYGDGVCDVDISELVKFHKQHGKTATLTAVSQQQQKGVLDLIISKVMRQCLKGKPLYNWQRKVSSCLLFIGDFGSAWITGVRWIFWKKCWNRE